MFYAYESGVLVKCRQRWSLVNDNWPWSTSRNFFIKVKFTLEQALKAQSETISVAVLFL